MENIFNCQFWMPKHNLQMITDIFIYKFLYALVHSLILSDLKLNKILTFKMIYYLLNSPQRNSLLHRLPKLKNRPRITIPNILLSLHIEILIHILEEKIIGKFPKPQLLIIEPTLNIYRFPIVVSHE